MLTNHFFEIAQNHFDNALPFVLYKKPNASIINGLFQENDAVYISKNLTESGFVFAPFNCEERTVLIPIEASEELETEFKALDSVIAANTETHKGELISIFKQRHIDIVAKAIKTIKNSDLQKVVVSRTESVNLLESNPIKLFKRLLQEYPKAFTYCWYHPKIGLWLGATPETLISIAGNRFTTMALAGTQPFNGSENVTWQAKEIEEQQLVTNFIVDSLNTKTESFSIGIKETVKAGKLFHLRTKISGIFNSNLKTLVDALHPTPAVCGLPKEPAKQFILDNENYNRAFYTGFLGELNLKEKTIRNTNRRNVENNAYGAVKTVSNLFVNLRCMQLTDVEATLYVGGGITKDSNPEKEWEETENKTQTMKKVLF